MTKYPPKKPTNDVFKAPVVHNWSSYQKDIFTDISKGIGHTLVIARAGASKTSVLVQGSRYVPKGKKTLFCAFNKHIQEELKQRLPSYVECSTLHSLGFRAIKQRFGNVEVDNDKCWKIVEEIVGQQDYDLVENICKTVDMCKAHLVDIPSQIDDLIVEYGIDLCDNEPKQFIAYVIRALRMCKEYTKTIDFNDMVHFPFIYHLNVGKYDYVFIDEAQDMSKGMVELGLSAAKLDGRIIAVLDDRQAIYAFMGADSRVLGNLRNRLNSPKELKLPICYRCPKKVIELAQTIVPDIQAYENAIDGEIINIHTNDLMKHAKAGSYVISRTNAPLIRSCMLFLKNNIPANMLGRDIGFGLLSLIKKSKKKSVSELLKWIIQWEKKEKENLLAKYPKANTDYIADKAECINMLCEDAETLDGVKKNIENLFKDNDEKKIILHGTSFKLKGKEANEVFVLTDTLRQTDEIEMNICYVSYTRAKQKLYLVSKFQDK